MQAKPIAYHLSLLEEGKVSKEELTHMFWRKLSGLRKVLVTYTVSQHTSVPIPIRSHGLFFTSLSVFDPRSCLS